KDWVASSLAAGAVPGAGGFFGDGDDAKMPAGGTVKDEAGIVSKVSSLTIGGKAVGTTGGGDHYGIGAENVVAVKVGGVPLVLKAGKSNDDVFAGMTGDFKVHEV